jgi:hypothetical protein
MVYYYVNGLTSSPPLLFNPSTEGTLVSLSLSIINDDNGNVEFGGGSVHGCGIYGYDGCESTGDEIEALFSVPADATTDYTTTIALTAEAYSPIPEPTSFSLLMSLLLIIFGADAVAKHTLVA